MKAYFSFLIFLAVAFSCNKQTDETPVPPIVEENLNLILKVNQNNRAIKISWNEIIHSNFQKYILIKSKTEISQNFNPLLSDSLTIYSSENSSDISFTDYNFELNVEKLYYNVFAVLNDTLLRSSNKWITYRELIFPGNSNFLHYDSRSKLLYNHSEQTIRVYNPIEGSLVAENVSNSNFFTYTTGDNGFGQELYSTKNDGKLHFYNGISLEEKGVQQYEFGLLSKIFTNSNGIIFTYCPDEEKQLKMIKRENWEIIGEFEVIDFVATGLFLDKTENEMVIANINELQHLIISENGDLIHNEIIEFQTTQLCNHSISSPNNEYFLLYKNGKIFNKNLEIIGQIPIDSITHIHRYAFSSDAQFIFVPKESNDNCCQIIQYSLPDLEEIATFNFSYNIDNLVVEENLLISIGNPEPWSSKKIIFEYIVHF